MPYYQSIIPGVPVDISDSTNSQGNSEEYALADHVHSHGTRGGGNLHAEATITESGFLSAGDKSKIDNITGTNTGDITLSGTPIYLTLVGQVLTLHNVNLTNEVTGALPVSNGGTGLTSFNVGDTLYASSSTTLSKLSGNTTQTLNYLSSVGDGLTSSAPDWKPLPTTSYTAYFLYNDSSDIPTYYTLLNHPSTGIIQNISNINVVSGQILATFSTNVDYPNTTFLPNGIVRFHINASQQAGTKSSQLYCEIYKRTSLGVETLLSTSIVSNVLTGIDDYYDIDCEINYEKLNASDRIVIKVLALVSGIGSAPTININIEGSTESRVEFPFPASSISSINDLPIKLYHENPVSPIIAVADGVNSVALGNGAYANATNSIAMGQFSVTRHTGSIVQSNDRFMSSGDSQAGRYFLRTSTTGAIPTELFLDGAGGTQRLTLQDNSTWTFKVTIVAHRTDVNDGHAGYTSTGVIYRQSGANTTAIQGNIVNNTIAESNPQWGINISADNVNGSLKILVTGQTGKVIRWLAVVDTVEITN